MIAFPWTRFKIMGAKCLYYLVRIFFQRNQVAHRNGITYDLDLNEGIDFSIFLFGKYQSYNYEDTYLVLNAESIVIDVGANMGCMSLQYAKICTKGRVFSLEPTDYAYKKLQRNIELNSSLKDRIIPMQVFAGDGEKKQDVVLASWPLCKNTDDTIDQVSGGIDMSTSNASSITIDKLCEEESLSHLSLIKIDTEGYEFPILKGAKETLKYLKPYIIFELGIYSVNNKQWSIVDIIQYLHSFDYRLYSVKKHILISEKNYLKIVPTLSTIDVIALPVKS